MRQRAAVWAARAFLVGVPLLILYLLLSLAPVHHSHDFWPYGHVHSVGEGVLAVLSYVPGLCLLSAALILGAIEGYMHLKLIGQIAFRKPRPKWRHRWKALDNPRYSGPKVTYEKPAPLVRGRIGSR